MQNNVSLSTGNDRHQTYISAGTTNGTGILPNHEYSRYNFTFRSVTKLWRDRLTLDYGGSYIIQRNQNMSAQGKYFNPLTAVYTFPRGEDFSTVQAYERFDTGRNMFLQYWPWGDQAMNMQNPYWVQYRNMRTNKRDRYMLNLNAKYQVNDWLNIAGRVRIDNTVGENEKKYWASTIQLFAGENGSYFANKQHVKLFYGDVIANVDKRLGKDFTLAANVGASWSRERSDLVGGGGKLDIANFFTLNNIIKEYRTLEQNRKHSMLTVSAFANLELGWRSMLYLTATARNDWASSQSGTEQLSFFYPSVGLSAVVTEMVRLPRWISFLKLRGSYAGRRSAYAAYLWVKPYYDSTVSDARMGLASPLPQREPQAGEDQIVGSRDNAPRGFGGLTDIDATWYQVEHLQPDFPESYFATFGYSSVRSCRSGRCRTRASRPCWA